MKSDCQTQEILVNVIFDKKLGEKPLVFKKQECLGNVAVLKIRTSRKGDC